MVFYNGNLCGSVSLQNYSAHNNISPYFSCYEKKTIHEMWYFEYNIYPIATHPNKSEDGSEGNYLWVIKLYLRQ